MMRHERKPRRVSRKSTKQAKATDVATSGRARESAALTRLDVLGTLVQFVPEKQFLFFATVSRGWRSVWGQRPKTTSYATEDSSLSQLRYSFDHGLPRDRVGVCSAIARLGNLELLKWAREQGCPWDSSTCSAAARSGNLGMLQWLREDENDCPWDEDTCLSAAKGGFVEVLKYAYENGCPAHSYECEFAAEGGHREVLEWSQQENRQYTFKWSHWTCAVAAGAGHLELLQWLRANKCKWNWRTVDLARKGGHMDIVNWAEDNGVPSRPPDTEADTELDIPPHRRAGTTDKSNPTPMTGPRV